VADLPHHHLNAGLHSYVGARYWTDQTKHVRIHVHLFGTLGKIHMHSSLIQIISKSHEIHFGTLNKSTFKPLNSNLFSSESSKLLSCCAVAKVIEGLKAVPNAAIAYIAATTRSTPTKLASNLTHIPINIPIEAICTILVILIKKVIST
jgi:hypothetical protein